MPPKSNSVKLQKLKGFPVNWSVFPASHFSEEEYGSPSNPFNQRIYDSALKLENIRVHEFNLMEPEKQLESLKIEIQVRLRITAQEIFLIGELLILSKQVCLTSGLKFQEWISENFTFSYETANNFMNVYKHCLGYRELAMQIKPSVLYKLSSPGFPDELRRYLFEETRIDEMTNGTLRRITEKFKTGGFKAIQEDVERLSHANLVYQQTNFIINEIENCYRTLEHYRLKMQGLGHSSGKFGHIEIGRHHRENEANWVIDRIDKLMKRTLNDFRNTLKECHDYTDRFYRDVIDQCGIIEPDEGEIISGNATEIEAMKTATSGDK